MADVFISYATEDLGRAEALAESLIRSGWSVWMDRGVQARSLSGSEIDHELAHAKCVLVLWSASALKSMWVADQAGVARRRGVMVAVRIDNLDPPRDLVGNAAVFDLTGWLHKDLHAPVFVDLLQAIIQLAARSSGQTRVSIAHPIASAASTHVPTTRNADASARPAGKLFLCYRREDTQGEAGRLYDRLTAVFGPDRVFMDIDSVPLGIDFVEHVTREIAQCSAVIVMIGRQWLTIKDKRRRRRLDSPDDLLRAEVAAALKQTVPVIPALVQDAKMPTSDDLPEDIRLLARRNGIALRHDQWREGVERLLKELDQSLGTGSAERASGKSTECS